MKYFLSIFILFSNILIAFQASVRAQIIPDSSLGQENSAIARQGVQDLITGGAIRGGNLFHSFREFNINQGQQVYFASPNGIANILTRVTGNNISKILGTLGVNGSANLFFINPNGIFFGENSRLDVAGSFVVSTADAIKLDEDGLFSATAPNSSTLLTVQPSALLFNSLRQNPAEISVVGNLAVGTGQMLLLNADIITSTGSLIAPGGIVELLANRVHLFNGSVIDTDAINNGDGGTVIVKGNDTATLHGQIRARGGEISGNGGFVELSGAMVEFLGTVDTSAANGFVGTFLIDPKDIVIQKGSSISGQQVSQALEFNNFAIAANNNITVDDSIITTADNSLSFIAGGSFSIAPNRQILLNGGNFDVKINDENALVEQRDTSISQFLMNPGSQIQTNGGNVNISSGSFASTSQIDTANGVINTVNNNTDIHGKNTNVDTKTLNSGNINLSSIGDISLGLLDSKGVIGNGGNIDIKTDGNIVTKQPIMTDSVLQSGDIKLEAAGDINIGNNISAFGATPGKITLTSGGLISSQTNVNRFISIANANRGAGTANDIEVTAKLIRLDNTSVVAFNQSQGQGGSMQVNADEILLLNSNFGTISNFSTGDAGNLNLNTRRLTIIREPGTTFPFPVGVGTNATQNSSGNAGYLTLNATESVEIVGSQPAAFTMNVNELIRTLRQGNTGISTSALGGGNSGKLTVNTGRLVIRDGAGITTFPVFAGQGGDLTVQANDIFLRGRGGIGTLTLGSGKAGDLILNANKVTTTDGAGIATASIGAGKAGDLILSVQELDVFNGSSIAATAFASGDSGNLIIKDANLIEVMGTNDDGAVNSGIRADSQNASGNAGKLEIKTERLVVGQGGEVTTTATGQGKGGFIDITAGNVLLSGGAITARSISGEGGNINLKVFDNLVLRNNGQISTRAGTENSGGGDGGDININSGFIVAIARENSDITANAFEGRGGSINITSNGIYGLQVADSPTFKTSDISASSKLGINGAVSLNTIKIDPVRGLIELPLTLNDPSNRFVAACPSNDEANFVITGRGGVPEDPRQLLQGEVILQDMRIVESAQKLANAKLFPSIKNQPQLVETTGWVLDNQGHIELVANANQISNSDGYRCNNQ